ncbi:MAG: response regulator, partial [Melioribacteraceae bacterium]|nr:response regulator [Melioribacteraceae bacterium]
VEAHNGFISVKSEVGKGTEFLVTLPVAKSAKKSPKNKIKKILIAEDEAPILESISYLLESYNYETYCAANGLLALEKYEANEDIDLLIIDKLMPGMDGIKVIKKIRERNKIVPIILTTGLQDADETKLKKIGVSKVLKKPYDFDLLIELIRGTSL